MAKTEKAVLEVITPAPLIFILSHNCVYRQKERPFTRKKRHKFIFCVGSLNCAVIYHIQNCINLCIR